MKAIKCDLPYAEEIEIHPMADLHIGDSQCDYTALLFVRFGVNKKQHKDRKQMYSIYVTHGSGSGRREGGKVNRLADLASIVDADIYIHAHTHLPLIMKQGFFRVSASNSSVAMVDKLFVNCSASLNYGGYGDRQAYKPSSKCCPIIYLNGLKHEMVARL